MSYTHTLGNLGSFFRPAVVVGDTDAGPMLEMDIGAASADHGEFICTRACVVQMIMFSLVSELAGGTTTAPTVVFTKRPTPLSATSESVVGTLTIPDATAVGKVVYKRVDVEFAVGDSLELSHTVGVGTPTGQGFPDIQAFATFEDPANNTDMVASS
jgi:hypothetical protein